MRISQSPLSTYRAQPQFSKPQTPSDHVVRESRVVASHSHNEWEQAKSNIINAAALGGGFVGGFAGPLVAVSASTPPIAAAVAAASGMAAGAILGGTLAWIGTTLAGL